MNNLPRQMLRRIVDKYGKEICSDARRCAGLLNDLCGSHRREINVLVNAVEEHIPLDLLAGAGIMPSELLLTRLEKRLEDQLGLTAEAARWGVESWALALGVATDAEIEERAGKPAETSPATAKTVQPDKFENKSADQEISNINHTDPVQPSKTPPPVTPTKTIPQASRQPVKFPQNLPPVYSPQNAPPIQSPAANPQTQPINKSAVTKKRFGLFRGCLIIILLLISSFILLLFGVPYAVEVMRETQRERNNEPPRFPIR